MKKFRFFLRFDKEEKWLEEMAEQGWLLCGQSLFYTFEPAIPEKRTIRIDFREPKSEKDFADYCALFEDSGWKHVAGTKSSGTQYFLKMDESSTGDIFSDALSRAGRYKRLSALWLFCAVMFIPLLLSMKTGGWIHPETLLTPKEWYLTPGLWELSGLSFWLSFLWETPFALMRGIGWLMPLAAIGICMGFGWKSRRLYRAAVHRRRHENPRAGKFSSPSFLSELGTNV